MKRHLTFALFKALEKGSLSLSPDARKAVCFYVRSKTPDGCRFVNRADKPDLYYTMFGWAVSYVLDISIRISDRHRLLCQIRPDTLDGIHHTAFMILSLLHRLMMLPKSLGLPILRIMSPDAVLISFLSGYREHGSGAGTNASAISLLLDDDDNAAECLKRMQDPSGGFLSNNGAGVPDLLSTAAALFPLKHSGIKPIYDPMDFIEAHWQENGGFVDNLIDRSDDIEYLFYGLLALGSAT